MTDSASTVLLEGGRVLTPAGLRDADVLVEDGLIRDVGRRNDAEGRNLRVVDVRGRLVMPAFVDAHVHLAATGLAAMGADLSATTSPDEALALLEAHAASSPMEVVLGHSWDDTRWSNGTALTRTALDRAVGGRPAYVSRVDVHSAFVSTPLLRLTGVMGGALPDGRAVEELPGWSGEGPLSRDAHHAVRGAVQRLLSDDDRTAAIDTALRSAAAVGVGMVHELGAPHLSVPGDFAVVDRLDADARGVGRAMPSVARYWGEPGALDLVRGLRCEGAAGDVCVDGAIGSRTAALHEPYADAAGARGHLYLTAADVAEHVVGCTEAGLQAGFHVIGDRAVAETVRGFEQAAARVGTDAVRDARHRLEHLEMVTPEQLAVLAELQVTASVQPLFDGWWGGPDGLYRTRLGDRAAGMNPFATMAAAGMTLAFGSDSPVTPISPWEAVRAAVRHHQPAQRLSVGAAVAAHTAGGWQAARRAGGVITPGAPAHLAVFDDADPGPDGMPRLDPDQPLPTCVLTLVGGVVAHEQGGQRP